jgi:shikimate kinase
MTRTCWITLVGPGGAGKTAVGALIAERLGIVFADLDRRFSDQAGDISDFINRFGYDAYARENVEMFRSMLSERRQRGVVALSSGFLTYRERIHPEYARLRRDIERSPTTFVLIPSLDCDICIAETVRRQLGPVCASRCQGSHRDSGTVCHLRGSSRSEDRDYASAGRRR